MLSLLTLPPPVLPVEAIVKAFAHVSLHSLCLLTDSGASLCGLAWPATPPIYRDL